MCINVYLHTCMHMVDGCVCNRRVNAINEIAKVLISPCGDYLRTFCALVRIIGGQRQTKREADELLQNHITRTSVITICPATKPISRTSRQERAHGGYLCCCRIHISISSPSIAPLRGRQKRESRKTNEIEQRRGYPRW